MEKKNRLILFALLLLGFLTYASSLQNEFLAWDDDWFVQENPYVNELSTEKVANSFSEFFKGQYSPVTALVMAVQYAAGDGTPAIFHWFSLFLHLLNAYLVFLISTWIFKNKLPALLLTALFILHPMQVESVSWISAQKLLISATFFLFSLLFYVNYLKKGLKISYLILSFLFFLISFLAKEQALMLSVLIIAFDYLHGRKMLDKRLILEKIPFLLAALVMGLVTLASARSGEFFSENNDKPGFIGNWPILPTVMCYMFTNCFSPTRFQPFILIQAKRRSLTYLIGSICSSCRWCF
jgi:protein O-mannosyl-transferase